jgi:hypothetical protein
MSVTALMTALAGTVTTGQQLISSFQYGVAFGQVGAASEQKKLWEANHSCLQSNKIKTVINQHNVEVGVLVCPTGDVLITGKAATAIAPTFKWVAWGESISTEISMSLSPIPVALADEVFADVNYQEYYIMCSGYYNGYIRQAVSTENGCFDLLIDPYSGRVISSYRVNCDTACY